MQLMATQTAAACGQVMKPAVTDTRPLISAFADEWSGRGIGGVGHMLSAQGPSRRTSYLACSMSYGFSLCSKAETFRTVQASEHMTGQPFFMCKLYWQ